MEEELGGPGEEVVFGGVHVGGGGELSGGVEVLALLLVEAGEEGVEVGGVVLLLERGDKLAGRGRPVGGDVGEGEIVGDAGVLGVLGVGGFEQRQGVGDAVLLKKKGGEAVGGWAVMRVEREGGAVLGFGLTGLAGVDEGGGEVGVGGRRRRGGVRRPAGAGWRRPRGG